MLIRQPLGNLILLERPVRPETLMSTVQAALRSRSRQYQMRDYLAERAKAEEALRTAEKLAVTGRLAASVAHEINNPLEAVVNLLYLISLSPSLQQSKEYAQTGMSELARVSEIVTQTLRFYRQNSKPVMVKVNEIMDSALVLYKARLSSAQIVLEKDFRQCPPIFARAGELRQLIVNLLGNALDAMSRGGTLKIRITNTREHKKWSACRHTFDHRRYRVRDSPGNQEKALRAVCQHKRRFGHGTGALGQFWYRPKTRRNDSGKKQLSTPSYWNGLLSISAAAGRSSCPMRFRCNRMMRDVKLEQNFD